MADSTTVSTGSTPARRPGRRLAWWGLAWALFSFFSVFVMAVVGFDFDPNDYGRSYWREQVGHRERMLVYCLLPPAAAVVLGGWALLKRGRSRGTIVLAIIAVVIAGLFTWATVALGLDAINAARSFSDRPDFSPF